MIVRIKDYMKTRKERKEYEAARLRMPYVSGQDVVLKNDLSSLEIDDYSLSNLSGEIVRVIDVNPYSRLYKVESLGRDKCSVWIERRLIDRDKSEDLETYIGF